MLSKRVDTTASRGGTARGERPSPAPAAPAPPAPAPSGPGRKVARKKGRHQTHTTAAGAVQSCPSTAAHVRCSSAWASAGRAVTTRTRGCSRCSDCDMELPGAPSVAASHAKDTAACTTCSARTSTWEQVAAAAVSRRRTSEGLAAAASSQQATSTHAAEGDEPTMDWRVAGASGQSTCTHAHTCTHSTQRKGHISRPRETLAACRSTQPAPSTSRNFEREDPTNWCVASTHKGQHEDNNNNNNNNVATKDQQQSSIHAPHLQLAKCVVALAGPLPLGPSLFSQPAASRLVKQPHVGLPQSPVE
jgi:hypothetical protein